MQVIIESVPAGSVKNWKAVKSLLVARGARLAYVVVNPFDHYNVTMRNGRMYKASATKISPLKGLSAAGYKQRGYVGKVI